jgi:hypothetical protein
MAWRWRLILLFVAFGGLLLWVWATDKSSPSHPDGQFIPLVIWTALFVGATWSVAILWLRLPESGSPRT